MSGLTVDVSCPHCGESLMDGFRLINNKKSICVNIRLRKGIEGKIYLSSIYGDYNYSSNIRIPDEEIVDFFCPHCGRNLRRKKIDCDTCGAPIISFNCAVGGRVSICSRNGCKNHYVVMENPDLLVRKFYTDYGFH